MNILLLGATRGVGLQFLKQALQKGDQVTAIARQPEVLAPLAHRNLTVVQGDAFRLEDIKTHLSDKDAVVSCLNTSKGVQESDELERMMHNCVEAMKEYGVKRIVYCASAGVENEIPGEKGKEVMHFLRFPLRDHAHAIQKMKDAQLHYTIARPGGLMDGECTGKYFEAEVGIPPSTNRIIRADVAHFMLKALHDESYIGKSIGLSN